MYWPDTKELLMGGTAYAGKAVEMMYWNTTFKSWQSSIKGNLYSMDKYTGYIGGVNKNYPNGIIHFTPPVDDYINNYSDVLDFINLIIKNGANENIVIKNFIGRTEQTYKDVLVNLTANKFGI